MHDAHAVQVAQCDCDLQQRQHNAMHVGLQLRLRLPARLLYVKFEQSMHLGCGRRRSAYWGASRYTMSQGRRIPEPAAEFHTKSGKVEGGVEGGGGRGV